MSLSKSASVIPAEMKLSKSKRRNKILRLYAGLEKIVKSEDGDSRNINYDDILKDFQTYFNEKKTKNYERLYDSDILGGKITDKHRGKSPLRDSEDDTYISGDSLLFWALSIPAEEVTIKTKIIHLICEQCPDMILFPKKINNENDDEITPLHVAIMKEDKTILKLMADVLGYADNKNIMKEGIQRVNAAGSADGNTAMMAGTLLGVAALTLNEDIFLIVLEWFALGLDDTNKDGDTIVHSLIKYVHVQPDKLNGALKMLRFILDCKFETTSGNIRETKREVRKLLMMVNDDGLNPLQLAARRQQYDFFEVIMQHEVYHSKYSCDGFYSEEVYDITEIETFAPLEQRYNSKDETPAQKTKKKETKEDYTNTEIHQSVLEYIIHHKTKNAFLFADFLPVREVIKNKWKCYRWWFWAWFAIHFIFMTFLSVAALYRSKLIHSTSGNSEVKFEYIVTKNGFVTGVAVAGLLFGLAYVALEMRRLIISRFQFKTSSSWLRRVKRHFTTPYSNFLFRVYFSLFYLLLSIDFFVALAAGHSSLPEYHNYCLIFAVIIGWYLFMFFLQGFKPFSFFTVLIQTVIIDMIKFAFVMLIFLVAFSIAMFMIMQGASTEEDDFNHFGKTMVKMLSIMLGIGELGILFQARQPILAILVFVLFVCFTTILLLNALIAMMSNSCTELMSSYRGTVASKMHCRLQKLSVILFLESYLPLRFCLKVGTLKKKLRYKKGNKWVSNTMRRFWTLSSPQAHLDRESKDSSDPVHQQSVYELLMHHTELRGKESSESMETTTEPETQQSNKKYVNIADIVQKTIEVSTLQTQEMSEVVI